ncbi:hypothetical protein [Nocardia sp. NBC_00511]|uniref:hypothetical protein n=1 Tax=Nocardia sp. NBC_00511 TaxID=2903591 RepID=UPI0030DE5B1E
MNTGVFRNAIRPAVGVLPVAMAIACASVAQAVPQPGVIAPGAGSPGAAGNSESRQPGTTVGPTAPTSPQVEYVVPENHRPVPVQTEPAPAVNWQELHYPEPVAPVAPIAPPPRTVRIGDFYTPAPDEVPDDILNPVNDASANLEAGASTFLQSVGVNPSRSDKISAMGAAGAVTGAALLGGAAAIGGGLVGAGIGGLAGAAAGAAIGAGIGTGVLVATAGAAAAATGGIGAAIAVPEAPAMVGGGALIGLGVGAAAGAAAGAAIGAAVVGIPVAVVGGVVGGGIGAVIGGADVDTVVNGAF